MADYFATGIIAYTGGDKTEAFKNFRLAIREDPKNVEAWYWMSLVVEDTDRKRDCLLQCLELEPTHSAALESLVRLERSEEPAPPSEPDQGLAEEILPDVEQPLLQTELEAVKSPPEEEQPILFGDLEPDELPSGTDAIAEPEHTPDIIRSSEALGTELRALSDTPVDQKRRKISAGAILVLTVIFILIIILGVVAVWFFLPGIALPFSIQPGIANPQPAGLPSGNSPEAAAATWLNAVLMRNSLEIVRITCAAEKSELQSASLRNELLTAITQQPAGAASRSIPDLSRLQFTPFEPTETKVRVLVSGSLRLTQAESVTDYPVDDRFTIIHENGGWKWCGSDALTAARVAAAEQAVLPTPTANIPPPGFQPNEWRIEPISYQETPSGEGWSEIQVDLVVENISPYVGLVQMNSGGRITTQGGEYPFEFDFNARVLPGLRTHSDRSGVPLSIHVLIPAQSEDVRLHIPFRVELTELINGRTVSGDGEFLVDPLQTLPEPASIFVNGAWDFYRADPASGIYAAEIGESIDFDMGLWTWKSFGYEPAPVDSTVSGNLVLRGVLENPEQPSGDETASALTLTPLDADAVQFLRVNQWGSLAPSDQTMQAIQAAPKQKEEVEVWRLSRDQIPVFEPETWCFIGFFKAQEDNRIQDLVFISCMPVLPP